MIVHANASAAAAAATAAVVIIAEAWPPQCIQYDYATRARSANYRRTCAGASVHVCVCVCPRANGDMPQNVCARAHIGCVIKNMHAHIETLDVRCAPDGSLRTSKVHAEQMHQEGDAWPAGARELHAHARARTHACTCKHARKCICLSKNNNKCKPTGLARPGKTSGLMNRKIVCSSHTNAPHIYMFVMYSRRAHVPILTMRSVINMGCIPL